MREGAAALQRLHIGFALVCVFEGGQTKAFGVNGENRAVMRDP